MPIEPITGELLRRRDQIIADKHAKEVTALEGRYQKLKFAHEKVLKELFDARHEGKVLAMELGFEGVDEALVSIQALNDEGKGKGKAIFRDCIDRAEKLEREVVESRSECENLRRMLRQTELERDQLKSSLVTTRVKAKQNSLAAAELAALQTRYDELLLVKERADKKYKEDYDKWLKFKKWLFEEESGKRKGKERAVLSPTTEKERKRKARSRLQQKRKMLQDVKDDISLPWLEPGNEDDHSAPDIFSPSGRCIIDRDCETKENRPDGGNASGSRSSNNSSTKSHDNSGNDFRSLFNDLHGVPIDKEDDVLRTPVAARVNKKRQRPDGGALFNLDGNIGAVRVGSRMKFEDDQVTPGISEVLFRASPPVVAKTTVSPPSLLKDNTDLSRDIPKASTSHIPGALRIPKPNEEDRNPFEAEQPLKYRRLGSRTDAASASNITKSPVYAEEHSNGRDGNVDRKDDLRCEHQKTLAAMGKSPTPQTHARTPHLADYSIYKGRGRYAKHTTNDDADTSINAIFTIDPVKNQGVKHAYDEVVRSKDERKKMDAGDCECCRDYYEAIGPLPPRLQPPLWRSPTKTPSPARPCKGLSHSRSRRSVSPRKKALKSPKKSAVQSHKQAISRHRHRWAAPSTPPGYWNIGFPDTQETERINEEAREMHRRKREMIENEVGKGEGKYKRR